VRLTDRTCRLGNRKFVNRERKEVADTELTTRRIQHASPPKDASGQSEGSDRVDHMSILELIKCVIRLFIIFSIVMLTITVADCHFRWLTSTHPKFIETRGE